MSAVTTLIRSMTSLTPTTLARCPGRQVIFCQLIERIRREQAIRERSGLGSAAMAATQAFAGRVLVTGANGSLGRALIEHLQTCGTTVRALVRSERAAATLRSMAKPPELAIVDWSDAPGLARATEGCDAAVHLVGVLKETPTQRYADAHEGTARALATAATLRRAAPDRVPEHPRR